MSEEVKVKDVMKKNVQTIDLNKSVADAARQMASKGSSYAVVLEGENAVGIITETDVVSKVVADGLEPRKVIIRDIMSTPIVTISPDAGINEAADLMNEYRIRRVVVVDKNGSLAGVITVGELARVLAKQMNYEHAALNAIANLRGTPSGGPYQ